MYTLNLYAVQITPFNPLYTLSIELLVIDILRNSMKALVTTQSWKSPLQSHSFTYCLLLLHTLGCSRQYSIMNVICSIGDNTICYWLMGTSSHLLQVFPSFCGLACSSLYSHTFCLFNMHVTSYSDSLHFTMGLFVIAVATDRHL